jgi:quinol---cytochrome-c reductase cytochrome c subunit
VRLLNRSLGRLSRHRRGPVSGLVVVLLGLLLTGGLYAAFSPASAQEDDSAAKIQQGRELFLVGCSFCHGDHGQGVKTLDGKQLGPPLIGVGAAAVDFQVGTGRMPAVQPGPQIPQKKVAAIARGGQIFLTNCTACHNAQGQGGAMPRGGYAPKIQGVPAKYVYEAMLTGPQAMDNFSNGNLTPDEKRDIIAYLHSLQDSPDIGGFGMGGLGPVSEGMFAWLVGIGSLVGVAIWIAAHTARSTKEKEA